jgi:hypothetical protein
MSDPPPLPPQKSGELTPTDRELEEILKPGTKSRWAKAVIQFLATAVTSAAGGFNALLLALVATGVDVGLGWLGDKQQEKTNHLFAACLQEHSEGIREVKEMVMGVVIRIPLVTEEAVAERVESPEFQGLVRRAFANWSRAEGEEKREIIRRLLCHAATIPVLDVDLFRLFFEWARRYSDLHWRVIKVLREHQPITRLEIWEAMGGERRRDDSAEADVFRCLIMDLSFGHLIEQVKAKAAGGQRLKATRPRGQRRTASPYLKSAFDDEKDYELTAVGRLFVHYTMTEYVPKLGAGSGSGSGDGPAGGVG